MRDTVIVVPCHDEEPRLQPEAFHRFLREHSSVGFLFVDDGSTDRTRDVLERIVAGRSDALRLVVLDENRGKAEAVRRGMQAAFREGARFAGFWDADLATPLEAIPAFEAVLREKPAVEIVLGSRVKLMGRDVRRSEVRHYLGRVFATCASLTLRLPVYDTQCGAKLFRPTEAVRELFATPFATRWIFDVEVLARYLRLHRTEEPRERTERRIYELVLPEWRDVDGTKVRLRDFGVAPLELARIWWLYMRSPRADGSPPGGPGPPASSASRRG